MAAIDFMGKNYGSTLRTIHIADGFTEAMPLSYDNLTQPEDPFVMLAWKCVRLESLRIIGRGSRQFSSLLASKRIELESPATFQIEDTVLPHHD